MTVSAFDFVPVFRTERGRGRYVLNVRYPSGGFGNVVRDRGKWAIACPWDEASSVIRFRTAEGAARHEYAHVLTLRGE